MKSAKLFVLISAGICLSTSLPAQTGVGLIGRHHAGVDYTHVDFNGTSVDRARGFAAEANLPWSPKFDAGFRYEYASVSGEAYDASMKAIAASILTHQPTPYGEAYFAGALGHAWDRVTTAAASGREDGAFWAVRAGYEVPMGISTAINASLGYTDAFSGRTARNQRLEFRLEGNHAFSARVAGVLSVTYQQIKRAPDGVLYTAGLRWMY